MAFNDQGNGKSPWDSSKNQPPDLDQIVEEWQKRFNKLFGGKSGSGKSGSGKRGPSIYLLIAMGLILWVLTGLYQVDDSERGVVLRFGEYHQTTTPGLKWRAPWPVDSVEDSQCKCCKPIQTTNHNVDIRREYYRRRFSSSIQEN